MALFLYCLAWLLEILAVLLELAILPCLDWVVCGTVAHASHLAYETPAVLAAYPHCSAHAGKVAARGPPSQGTAQGPAHLRGCQCSRRTRAGLQRSAQAHAGCPRAHASCSPGGYICCGLNARAAGCPGLPGSGDAESQYIDQVCCTSLLPLLCRLLYDVWLTASPLASHLVRAARDLAAAKGQ